MHGEVVELHDDVVHGKHIQGIRRSDSYSGLFRCDACVPTILEGLWIVDYRDEARTGQPITGLNYGLYALDAFSLLIQARRHM